MGSWFTSKSMIFYGNRGYETQPHEHGQGEAEWELVGAKQTDPCDLKGKDEWLQPESPPDNGLYT